MAGKRSNETSLAAHRDVMDTLQQISGLLNTGLDSETLSIVARLCELGVNPEALASVIKELRREVADIKAAEER